MGRGRAKAKQTKVARRLKYSTTGTDLDALAAELAAGDPTAAAVEDGDADDEFDDDEDDWDDGTG
jgi:hypothetical protein